MSVASRPVATGKTRTCPHCKATILESLSICPGCMHHLRFDTEAAKRQVSATPALRVEGMIRHPPLEQPLEYFVIIAIRNDRGEEVTRQVVNVGALQASEKRTFTLSVEVLPPQAPVPGKSGATATKTGTQPAGATIRAPNPQPTAFSSSGATATGAAGTTSSGSAGSAGSGATTAGGSGPPGAGPGQAGADPGQTSATGSRPAVSSPPNTTGSSTTSRPQGGYPGGLKPPNPGGPKRH
ncbi:MAG TPA: hypothetical protein VMT29_18495 [Steroidobacteraceae bacterium]|nr:hypothetical protein [Steroidobacteraceae bacterium]